MFSFAKKPAAQEVVLQDLTENQLTQVAGGHDCKDHGDHSSESSKSSKSSKSTHHHHHHHHHHHWTNDHDGDNK